MKRLLSLIFLLALISSCATVTGRTAGEIIDDSSITTAINLKIIEDPELKYFKIDVDSFRGNVTLTGVVSNERSEQRLIELAKGVRGVKSVKSNLIIEEKSKNGNGR